MTPKINPKRHAKVTSPKEDPAHLQTHSSVPATLYGAVENSYSPNSDSELGFHQGLPIVGVGHEENSLPR